MDIQLLIYETTSERILYHEIRIVNVQGRVCYDCSLMNLHRARPQYENHEFMLLTTFPNRELTEGSQTLADAGLLNAAIMQRLK